MAGVLSGIPPLGSMQKGRRLALDPKLDYCSYVIKTSALMKDLPVHGHHKNKKKTCVSKYNMYKLKIKLMDSLSLLIQAGAVIT